MIRFTSRFHVAALAGIALSVSAIHAQQQPASMPTPRYQSPGLGQPQAPTPVVQFPVTPAITPNGTVVEDVIVRVNDQIISRSDLERAQEQLQQELAQGGPSADPAERQRNLLRDLIDQQLLISKAKELGVNADAEVVRRLDEIRKQNNLPSMEALEEAARKQGVSFEDFKASIRNRVLTESVVRDEVGRNIRLTHANEEEYYEKHKQEFAQPEQVKLSEILIPTAADASEEAVQAAQVKAQKVYDDLKGGADFAATAKSVSGGPTAAQGGELGIFKRGQLAKVLEDKTFSQKSGEFTEPIRTRQGYVILKTVEYTPAGTPPLEKIEGEVQNAIYQEQINPALRAYLTKLREDSYVDIKPGFVDSGASPNQTKPVYSAYTAPAPKKKTERKRRLIAEKDQAKLRKAGLTEKNGTVQALAAPQLDKHGRPKKIKREKVRFGQAPTTALPEAATDTDAANTASGTPGSSTAALKPSASGQDTLGTADSNPLVAANAAAAAAAAQGTQVAAVDDPADAPVVRKKTRFSSREPEVKQKKISKDVTKIQDKVKATPQGPSTQEKQTAAVQSSALGLNGDTAKKKKKRQKGEAKERLQEKAPEAKPELVDNGLPDRLHQENGPQAQGKQSASSATGNLPAENSKEAEKQRRGKQPVTADTTTLAPADQPAPGTTLPAQVPSSSGVTPSSNNPVPQTSTQPQ